MSAAHAAEILRIRGMSCASCARRIERAVSRLDGVVGADVSYAAGTLRVRAAGPGVERRAVSEAVTLAGYEVVDDDPADVVHERELSDQLMRLAVAVFFGMLSMLPSMVVYLGGETSSVTEWWLSLASGVLALPVVCFSGWPFVQRAWRAVRSGDAGMDVLVATGAGLSYGYSVHALYTGSAEVYFDTSTAIVTFLLLGRLVEHGARRRGTAALRSLHRLAPDVARRLDLHEHESLVPSRSVQRGERVRVRAAARVPLDGRVVRGSAKLDRSFLTGESWPVSVGTGDRVEAGSLLLDAPLDLEVEAVVGERAIDRMANGVDAMLATRPPLQKLADLAASGLTVAVLVCAATTALATYVVSGSSSLALLRAVAVTVVACPCALGLATPMAAMVAVGRAASRGILFRDAEVLERAASLTALYFDKTGTLTEGRPRVTQVLTTLHATPEEVLGWAALAERDSDHPLAHAVRAAQSPAAARFSEVQDDGGARREIAGCGVEYRDARRAVWVGSRSWLEDQGVSITREPGADEPSLHVAVDGRWMGAAHVDDPPRVRAAEVLRRLREQGLALAMVTGDDLRIARAVAQHLHVGEVHAQQMPDDKAAIVLAARAEHECVGFVGDGMNDGPALAAAHVGIAATDATDLARAAAGIVLRSGGIERLLEALSLARHTRSVMRQNLAWALFYNVLAVPAAAFGMVSPWMAALAMAASSLSVVLNSLRLRGAAPVL